MKRSKKLGVKNPQKEQGLKKAKVQKLENKVHRMKVDISSTNASNAADKQKINDLRIQKVALKDALDRGLREIERRKMTVAKHLSQKTDVQEQIERLRLDYEKLKVSTIEEIESFTKKFDNLKVEYPSTSGEVPALSLSPVRAKVSPAEPAQRKSKTSPPGAHKHSPPKKSIHSHWEC